jgi:NADH dehydrogenase FAD-containing subunit
MSGKIEQLMIDYFKLINDLPYKDVVIDINESNKTVVINIHVKRDYDYFLYRLGFKAPIYEISNSMGIMFPYVFKCLIISNLKK